MSRYIDADALRNAMYHEAFETDTKMQRWDSGCWIRYKLFENILDQQPTADAVEVVRCKDCKHGELGINPNDNTECVYCDTLDEVWEVDDFCVMGERREDERNK